MQDRITRLLWLLAIFLILLIFSFIYLERAQAHDWYDGECCSGQDCFPLAVDAVTPTSGGWLIKESGEVIPYGDPRERKSKDSGFHRCLMDTYINGVKAHATRCLYVPDLGS